MKRILMLITCVVCFAAGAITGNQKASAQVRMLGEPNVVAVPNSFGELKQFATTKNWYIAVFQEKDGTLRVVRLSPSEVGRGAYKMELKRTD